MYLVNYRSAEWQYIIESISTCTDVSISLRAVPQIYIRLPPIIRCCSICVSIGVLCSKKPQQTSTVLASSQTKHFHTSVSGGSVDGINKLYVLTLFNEGASSR